MRRPASRPARVARAPRRCHARVLLSPRRSYAQLTQSIDAGPSAGKRASLLAERALVRMANRQYEEALVDWAAAAELVPPCGAAATAASPEQQQALEAWSADAKAGDTIAPALAMSMLGMLLHLRGNYDEAMDRYNQALYLSPSSIDVLLKRSSLWFEKENLSQARGCPLRLVAAGPDPRIRRGAWQAHADFDAALALDATHPDIYCHRGQLHMLQNELGKAISDLRKAVQLDPASVSRAAWEG